MSGYPSAAAERRSEFRVEKSRAAETFRSLETAQAAYIINVHHVVELIEETPVP